MTAPRYDVFLSYSWQNLATAEKLAAALADRGLRVFRDQPELADYDEISPEIEDALRRSRGLVALYTRQFTESRYCEWELYTALSRAYDLDGHTQRVMAALHGVGYADVRPARLAGLRLPPPGTAPAQVAASVAAKLSGIDDQTFGDAPTHPEPDWYPHPSEAAPRFRGRRAELWELHDALAATSEAERAGPRVTRLVGLGGQGKTLLAEEYARRFARDHPGGIYILRGFGSHRAAAGPAAVRSWLHRQLALIVGMSEDDDPAQAPAVLRRRLAGDGRPYLWVIDDLPPGLESATFRDLLAPTPTGRTLVTARYDDEDLGGSVVQLHELDESSAVRLLTSRRPPRQGDRRAARALANDDLGRHAQALDLAAGLAARPDFAGYAELRAQLAVPSSDVLQLAADLRGELPGGHEPAIAATLLRSIERSSAAGRAVLRVASLLANAPIPERLVADALARLGHEDAAAAAAAGFADSRSLGLARSLRDEDSPLWSVHAVICRSVRFWDLTGSRRVDLRTVLVSSLISELERSLGNESYQPVMSFLPHVAEVAREGTSADERYARNEAARVYVGMGRLDEAAEIFWSLYRVCRDRLGERDPTTLAVLVGVGAVTGLRGRYRQALELKIMAHAGLAALLGEDHSDTLTARNNVAVARLDLREFGSSEAIFAEVYRARRQRLGLAHSETVMALGNVAAAAAAGGRHRFALRLRQAVYERLLRTRGPADVLVLDALSDVGCSQLALGGRQVAADIFAQVRAGRRQVLGETHPQTLTALANLGICQADPARVRRMTEEAYRGLVLGGVPGMPDAQRVLHNLVRTGRTDAAGAASALVTDAGELKLAPLEDFDVNTDRRVALFEQACAVHEELVTRLGPDEPATMVALCHLAHATALLGQLDRQLDDAGVLIADAADGLAELLGADHPNAVLAERLRTWIDDLRDDQGGGA